MLYREKQNDNLKMIDWKNLLCMEEFFIYHLLHYFQNMRMIIIIDYFCFCALFKQANWSL